MQPSELAAGLSGAHAAVDAAWAKLDAAYLTLRAAADEAAHARAWATVEAETTRYEAAVQRLAVLTQQLLPKEARHAA